jgi:hypothetical protein
VKRSVLIAGALAAVALDRQPGETNGRDSHAFDAGWYVLSPAGRKIEKE